MIKTCLYCQKVFVCKIKTGKYCCHKCSSDASIGHKDSEETKLRRSRSLMGHPVSKKSIDKLVEYIKRNGPWNKGKHNIQQSGENHWNWKGGITNETKKRVAGVVWKKIRLDIYKRDNYTCQNCHKEFHGKDLDCHHIVPYRLSRDNSSSNLISLCKRCHTLRENDFRFYEVRNPLYCRPELFDMTIK